MMMVRRASSTATHVPIVDSTSILEAPALCVSGMLEDELKTGYLKKDIITRIGGIALVLVRNKAI